MADNRRREIRNKRREKQRLKDMATKKVSEDWEEYANRELLDIGQDYDYMEYEEDEIFPRHE